MSDALPIETTGRGGTPVTSRPVQDLSGTVRRAAVDAGWPNAQGEGAAGQPVLRIHVVGEPAPQGSKRGYVANGRAILVDDNKARLRDWRSDVKNATQDAILALDGTGNCFAILGGPVEVDITFLLRRPKSHYRTGRNAHLLRDNAPARPAGKPDTDKLLRGCLDALKAAGVYVDDAQVTDLTGRKRYAPANGHTGAVIYVYAGSGC